MTHYYEIEYQRENEFDGLLSIDDIVNIKPNKKNEMEYEGNEDKLYPLRNTPCYNQILSKARNNFLIISSAYVKSLGFFFRIFPWPCIELNIVATYYGILFQKWRGVC